jgi:hypothetical protein
LGRRYQKGKVWKAKGKTGPSSKLRFVVAAQAHGMFGPEMSNFLLDEVA